MSVNLSVNGSRTNAILASGTIAFENATCTNKFVLGGAITNIWLTSSGKFAYSTAGSFDHYATIQGRVTDVPMSSDGKIIDSDRLKKYLLPFSNAS